MSIVYLNHGWGDIEADSNKTNHSDSNCHTVFLQMFAGHVTIVMQGNWQSYYLHFFVCVSRLKFKLRPVIYSCKMLTCLMHSFDGFSHFFLRTSCLFVNFASVFHTFYVGTLPNVFENDKKSF